MQWVRGIAGGLLLLLGGVWLGQGLNLIPGSFMTARPEWAVAGTLLILLGLWLLSGLVRRRTTGGHR